MPMHSAASHPCSTAKHYSSQNWPSTQPGNGHSSRVLHHKALLTQPELDAPSHLLISSNPLHPTGVLGVSAACRALLPWLLLLLPPLWLVEVLFQPAGGAAIKKPCVVVKVSVVENFELCKPRTS